ncbi:dephospho-CoA kinase [Candidatus Thiosymbion oneisti]|uniref:dephospho-CoA kinase n=1 Tax=Candidatus Thiosymbion oneisti TaxID=589554 RepID=UPI000A7E05B6|nr:dephospho-CoA kinase [Candidatus Thiosymbion oneisti]
MLVVALTGGVGSGKSSVAVRLGGIGVPVIDADAISRDLTAPGNPVLDLIAEAFGARFIDAAGHLDRAAMRALVFSDTAARARLESILHPRIVLEMQRRLAKLSAPYAVLEIPLLFEAGQTALADRILVVDLPESEQIRRVRHRSGLDVAEIQRIIDSQVPRSQRLEGADDIIDNSGDPQALEEQVNHLHRYYLELAATRYA